MFPWYSTSKSYVPLLSILKSISILFVPLSVPLPTISLVFVSLIVISPLVTGLWFSLSVTVMFTVVFLIVALVTVAIVLDVRLTMFISCVVVDVLYSSFPVYVTVIVLGPTGKSSSTVMLPSVSVSLFIVVLSGSVIVTGAFAIGVSVIGSFTVMFILVSSYILDSTVMSVVDARFSTLMLLVYYCYLCSWCCL